MNEIKFCPAMVRCGESPRNAVICVRTPVAGFLFTPKKDNVMTNEKLNLRPLYELLAVEVDLDELVEHLHNICYYFSQNSMKVSCWDGVPVDEQEVICQYWIERLKQLFEELKK